MIPLQFTFLANQQEQDVLKLKAEHVKKNIQSFLVEEEPELRDQVYTSILWLRLNAEEYYQNGKYEKSLNKLRIVVKLINVNPEINLKFTQLYPEDFE